MANPAVLTNDNYLILFYLYNNKDKDQLIKVTQSELAEIMGYSRPTINASFKVLKEAGYLIHDKTRVGRYYLTNDAIELIETFKKLSK